MSEIIVYYDDSKDPIIHLSLYDIFSTIRTGRSNSLTTVFLDEKQAGEIAEKLNAVLQDIDLKRGVKSEQIQA